MQSAHDSAPSFFPFVETPNLDSSHLTPCTTYVDFFGTSLNKLYGVYTSHRELGLTFCTGESSQVDGDPGFSLFRFRLEMCKDFVS